MSRKGQARRASAAFQSPPPVCRPLDSAIDSLQLDIFNDGAPRHWRLEDIRAEQPFDIARFSRVAGFLVPFQQARAHAQDMENASAEIAAPQFRLPEDASHLPALVRLIEVRFKDDAQGRMEQAGRKSVHEAFPEIKIHGGAFRAGLSDGLHQIEKDIFRPLGGDAAVATGKKPPGRATAADAAPKAG